MWAPQRAGRSRGYLYDHTMQPVRTSIVCAAGMLAVKAICAVHEMRIVQKMHCGCDAVGQARKRCHLGHGTLQS